MKKRIIGLSFAFGILLTLFIANVSASIYFSPLESTYNIGDNLINEVTIDSFKGGFLNLELVCDGKSINFNLLPNSEGKTRIEFPLTSAYIQNMNGNCYFLAKYKEETRKSMEFKISKELQVKLLTSAFFANPGENIIVEGSATRLNGVGANGDVEVNIPVLVKEYQERVCKPVCPECVVCANNCESNCTGISNCTLCEAGCEEECPDCVVCRDSMNREGVYYGKINDGKFLVNFTLDKEMMAGDYRIDVYAYEKSEGEVTSQGNLMANLKVFQVLTSADIVLSGQSFDPGQEFEFKPILLDQSSVLISEDVSVIITNELMERIFEEIVKSDETIKYNIPTNMSAGYYELKASKADVSSVKKIYINEKAMVSLELVNETLVVTNIGNIPYVKDIQIELNGKPFLRSVSLGLGEVQRFKLSGANEVYDIRITDGETEISKTGVMLTGKATNVRDSTLGEFNFSSPFAWIFIILILGAGFFFLFKNILKEKSFAYPFSEKMKSRKTEDLSDKKIEHPKAPRVQVDERYRDNKAPGILIPPSQAEQVLVLKGHKNKAVVIAIKIKNKIRRYAKASIERAIEPAYKKRAAVCEQGDYIFIVFSPLLTRVTKNETEAAKIAEGIKSILDEHNKKSSDKIEFGIGINSGDIINKVENKRLKFTALGNVMVVVKRLAESSKEQILVTREVYEHGITDIKIEKKKVGTGEIYELKGVVDKEKNEKFIKGFLERMGK